MLTVGSTTLSRMFTPAQLEMLRAAQENLAIIPTELIRAHRQAYNGLEKRGYVEGGGLTRTALNYFPLQKPTPAIPEPPIDPEDTKPLPPYVQPLPEGTEQAVEDDQVSEPMETPQQAIQAPAECPACDKGYEWCFRRDCPHVPCQARDWYTRAYRYQRASYPDVSIDDVPLDVMIAARESILARLQPEERPFILRAWYKRFLDARDAMAQIPLYDDKAFNDAVLDFKCIKAKFMALEERWYLRQAAGARR